MTRTVVFSALPQTLEEMKSLPEASLKTPEGTAALTIAALCLYPENREECYAMLDYLRGPRPLSNYDKQFIRDRFMDKVDYVPRSFFLGATPGNNYTPSKPLTLEFRDSAAQFSEEGYCRLDIRSGGADTPRQVTLRLKPSTGEWFLWEQMLLGQIRKPAEQDPWA